MKYSQKSLEARFIANLKEHAFVKAGDRVVVALSGGPDSVCLFDLLFKLKDQLGLTISVCHYNHRLRGQASEDDQAFVETLAKSRGVACFVERAPQKDSFKNEETARLARYDFFQKILGESRGDKIAIAHNSNDLSETLLLHLVRGSGLAGLRGIPRSRQSFFRPLLPFSREEILAYLAEHKLASCQDLTNADLKYDRNYLRHQVLPRLLELNPNLITTLATTARGIETDYDYLVSQAEIYLGKSSQLEADKVTIDRDSWLLLHPALKALTLRLSLAKLAPLRDITAKQLEEVLQLLEKGEGKKHKILPSSLRVELASGKIIMSRD